jgi:CRP-like cAMP-binding protein
MSVEDLLRKMEFCRDLSNEELRMIQSTAEEVSLAVGEYLIKENKPCDFIYIIVDGSVDVTKSGAHIVALEKGDAIGELSFLDKRLPSASVRAREDTTLVMIPHRELENLMKKNNEFACKVYKAFAIMLSGKIRATNDWLASREWIGEFGKEVTRHPHF